MRNAGCSTPLMTGDDVLYPCIAHIQLSSPLRVAHATVSVSECQLDINTTNISRTVARRVFQVQRFGTVLYD